MQKKKNKKPKLHLKKGDLVEVIAGDSKGKRGTVLQVFPKKQRAIVEDCNMVYKHLKPTAENPTGSIQEIEAPIHISNLMVVDPDTDMPRRKGVLTDENNQPIRNEKGRLQYFFKEHTSKKD